MLCAGSANAQLFGGAPSGCRDTVLGKQPGIPCDGFFEPVCGCDNRTYKNECFTRMEGLLFYTQGPCENLALNLNPNPVYDVIFLEGIVKTSGTIRIFITDIFGKTYFSEFYYADNTNRFYRTINISNFRPGMYMLFGNNGNEFSSVKFVVVDY